MKIDVFSHILPKKYLETYSKKNPKVLETIEARTRPVTDLEVRLRLMDRYPDVIQVLTVANPPLEVYVKAKDAVDLAKLANDELAELVETYPDKFIAAVGCLPINDMNAALEEADRVIGELGFKGVQVYSRIAGKPLDEPKFKPLFKKMAEYELPIWIHPAINPDLDMDVGVFSWPFETASAMYRLVMSGIFIEFPDIKFITHHCGSMVPFLEKRIKWILALVYGKLHKIRNPLEHFRKFYNDTALYGNTGALMLAYNFFGADHLLYGTDSPLGPRYGLTQETLDSIERMEIPQSDKEKIMTQNAMNLLSLAL